MRGKQVKGQRVGEAPVLVPTDTLLQLIQIRVSKTGRLNLQASQQHRGRCQLQSLSLRSSTHTQTHAGLIPPLLTRCHQQLAAAQH